jgi:FHS family glucose/mannose:H+ symporter-like MFS transporter
MPASLTERSPASVRLLTLAAYVSFIPVGVATVLLGPMLPILSARWSLNYAQAGALFPVQYVASTAAVALSGVLVSRFGFRFAIQTGLLLVAVGLGLLMAGPRWLAVICIAAYGAGNGVAVPAANLMVAELNPGRRSATLNWQTCCWSMGAGACPFLVAAAAKAHHVPSFLLAVAGLSLVIAVLFTLAPAVEPRAVATATGATLAVIRRKLWPFLMLAALFFVYVGTENGFGFWVASFAKSLGSLTATLALMTPSFFYAALMLGRMLAPFLLRSFSDIKLAQVGLILSCAGMAGMIFSHQLLGVIASASAAGLGLSAVYPITISMLSKDFAGASSRIGSFMFVLSNIGGGSFPWMVGVTSDKFGTLKAGLFVPLLGCALMYVLYLQPWDQVSPAAPEVTS